MIWANPKTFALVIAVIIAIVWLIANYSYSTVLSNKNSQIELQDRQLADYKQKLDGATPDQAKAKIEGLERAVHMAIGAKWEPLTKAEIALLVPKLRLIQKSRIQIIYENAFGKELAQSFLDAFREAGWDGAPLVTGTGFGDEVLIGYSTRAVAAKEAIESSSNIKIRAIDTEKEIADLMVLGVGINSH
jgi:hypothetical protein